VLSSPRPRPAHDGDSPCAALAGRQIRSRQARDPAGGLLPSLRRPLLAALLALCATSLGACADTLQDQPTPRTALEPMVLNSRYPVYWVGEVFHRLAITEASHDPSGAYTIHYGDCTEGGQYTCVSPLTIATSPDNSFVPGGLAPHLAISVRGVRAISAQEGTTIEIPTDGVIVSIDANGAGLARAAAQTMVPINEVGVPGAPLPGRLPNTGFAEEPLAAQKPLAVRLPGHPPLEPADASPVNRAAAGAPR
jgi:hypothetical protein